MGEYFKYHNVTKDVISEVSLPFNFAMPWAKDLHRYTTEENKEFFQYVIDNNDWNDTDKIVAVGDYGTIVDDPRDKEWERITMYQVDAFTDKPFHGNAAAVCPLGKWLSDEKMQRIAAENNLSETAFFIQMGDRFHIRWFTPVAEVDLCGHATLATAYVIFHEQMYKQENITFESRSGDLHVSRRDDWFVLDFPNQAGKPCSPPAQLMDGLGHEPEPVEVLVSTDYMVVYESESQIRDLKPDFSCLSQLDLRGVIITAPGDEVDFVSRFFVPQYGINEDPVTGSAHCILTPYWAEKLDKTSLTARQLSQRGGELQCELKDDRVLIAGKAVKYMEAQIILRR